MRLTPKPSTSWMDREIIERVKEAADILQEMAERGVELKRSGRRWRALCPFHNERTPSFYVDPELGLYHCFGCGASGDVITFVMEKDGLSFWEAVLYLAEKYGVEVPKEERREGGKLSEALELALNFYHQELFGPGGSEALEYLLGRGITRESIAEFSLGWAPGGDALIKRAHERGLGVEVLAGAGLAFQRDGAWHDLFRRRVIFPIFSPGGRQVIAFGGRVLGDDEPKYLNSPETPLFKKGETLYAFHLARRQIRSTGEVIIAEGYLDVIALHQAGYKNAVAPLGTALTPQHARRLARLAERAVLLFDGDEAGLRAALRSTAELMAEGVKVRVGALPKGEDPHSLITRGRAEELGKVILEAKSGVEFAVRTLGRGKAVRVLAEALRKLRAKSPISFEETVAELAEASGFSAEAIVEEVLRPQRGTVSVQKRPRAAERELAAYLFLKEREAEPWAKGLLDLLGATARSEEARRALAGDAAEAGELIRLRGELEKVAEPERRYKALVWALEALAGRFKADDPELYFALRGLLVACFSARAWERWRKDEAFAEGVSWTLQLLAPALWLLAKGEAEPEPIAQGIAQAEARFEGRGAWAEGFLGALRRLRKTLETSHGRQEND